MANVCVTGASRGIGHGFARAYLDNGDTVLAAVRNPESEGAKALATEYPDRCIPVRLDVSDPGSVERAAVEMEARLDALDLLINNAGVARPPEEQRIDDIRADDVNEVFGVNTLGPLRVSQRLFPLLRRSERAKLIMISSNAGSIASQGGGRGVPYCVSKAALNMLTKLLSFHCRPEGVAIAALHPGWVRTDMAGPGGTLSVEESVSSMMKVIARLGTDGPVYMDYRGNEMPW